MQTKPNNQTTATAHVPSLSYHSFDYGALECGAKTQPSFSHRKMRMSLSDVTPVPPTRAQTLPSRHASLLQRVQVMLSHLYTTCSYYISHLSAETFRPRVQEVFRSAKNKTNDTYETESDK